MLILQTSPVAEFWDLTFSNIITWAMIVGGVVVARYVDMRLIVKRVDNIDEWRTAHMEDAKQRDQLITELKVAVQKVDTLAETFKTAIIELNMSIKRLEERLWSIRGPG